MKTGGTNLIGRLWAAMFACTLGLALSAAARAQTIAVITPDNAADSRWFASLAAESFPAPARVLDADLARAGFDSVRLDAPFNMAVDEAVRVGEAVGCHGFVLVRAATQRRTALGRPEYYEAYAFTYLVSARTGRLIDWKLHKFEAPKPEAARQKLGDAATEIAAALAAKLRTAIAAEAAEEPPPQMEEIGDTVAAGVRAPVPYRRLKPDYTAEAAFYDIAATVDLLVFLNEKGEVVRTKIARWAGFGLDASVERNVRSMNWRPAHRGPRPFASKFLVRYNFKKVEPSPK